MAPLAIYAHRFPPERFTVLTGMQIGIGTLGTLIATAPLAWASGDDRLARNFLAVAAFTWSPRALVLIAAARSVTMPARRSRHETGARACPASSPSCARHRGSAVPDALAAYSSFGLIVGLWGGPYLTHVYGYGLEERGDFLLVAGDHPDRRIVAVGPDGPRPAATSCRCCSAPERAPQRSALSPGRAASPSMLVLWFAVFGFVPPIVRC